MALQTPISFTLMEIVPNADNSYFRTKPLRVAPGETIAHLRELSAESFNKSSTDIQLIYYGKPLEDALTFEAAGIRNGSTVMVYPKIAPERRVPQSKCDIRKKIYRGISHLSKMKYLNVLARTEFLEKLHREMPDLDTGTLGIVRASRALNRYTSAKHTRELDELAEKYPLLGDILMKAVDYAPALLGVHGRDSPNQFSLMESHSDESMDEGEAMEDSIREDVSSNEPRIPSTNDPSSDIADPTEPNRVLLPGPSDEPQPGPSRGSQPAVTGPMLQAALQAAYTSQAEIASQTFGWQLGVMKEMGFFDEKTCIEALVRSGGDVDMAVNLLLQN